MLRVLLCLLSLSLFFSCQEPKEKLVSRSTIRNYNRILVVVNDSLWRGSVGDSIRQYLAANMEGIRPVEPIFTLDQVGESLFQGKEKQKQNVILFNIGANENYVRLEKNKFSNSQNYFEINGVSESELVQVFKENVDSISKFIHDFEIQEIQKSLLLGKTHEAKYLKRNFKMDIDLPIEYKRVLTDGKFVWYKMDIASGNSNVLIYEIPFAKLPNLRNSSVLLEALLAAKDSVVSKYVHTSDSEGQMHVDGDYVTYNRKLSIDNNEAFELKGSWDMNNSFMDGPFICYPIRDEKNKRYLFVEGFTYNPSMNKRDILLELEAIIKSVKLY